MRVKLASSDGSQLLEFALVLPMILFMILGIVDISQAYNLKQIVNNASREGARVAVSESSSLCDLNTDVSICPNPPNPPVCFGNVCVQPISDVVANYLTQANVHPCVVGSLTQTAKFTWEAGSSTAGCGDFKLKIERAYAFTDTNGASIGSRISITYPVPPIFLSFGIPYVSSSSMFRNIQ